MVDGAQRRVDQVAANNATHHKEAVPHEGCLLLIGEQHRGGLRERGRGGALIRRHDGCCQENGGAALFLVADVLQTNRGLVVGLAVHPEARPDPAPALRIDGAVWPHSEAAGGLRVREDDSTIGQHLGSQDCRDGPGGEANE
eukprot:scaffold3345_cov117-Isochrysis_galbana.AAC.2